MVGFITSRLHLHENSAIKSEIADETLWVKVALLNRNIPPSKVEYLKTGPSLENKDGKKIVRISNIESTPIRLTHVTSPDELYLLPVNPKNMEVRANIDLLCSRIEEGYSFEGEPLVPGKKLTFNFGFCSFEGTIISIHDDKIPHQ